MSDNAAQTAYYNFSSTQKPQNVVKEHIDAAISDAGHTPATTISTDYSFDTDDYDSECGDLVCLRDNWRADWLDGHSETSTHFNLLLMNNDEFANPDGARGVSTIGYTTDGLPRGGVFMGADDIGEHGVTADRYGSRGDDVEGAIRGAIHEIEHNIGAAHPHGLRYTEQNYLGGETTYATPMGCNSNRTCSPDCSDNSTNKWDHYFDDCAVDAFEL